MSSVVVSGDVSGSVTLSAPSAAGSVVVTLPSASGTMLTSATPFSNGQGPAFSAYTTVATSLANNTNTKIVFDTKSFDTATCYSTANSRFTPNVAGYYQVTAGTLVTGVSAGLLELGAYKNGSIATWGSTTSLVSSGTVIQVTALVYCNGSTDYIEIYGYQNSGGSISNNTSSVHTNFSAVMVRGA